MKIAVCMKRVPDSETRVKIAADGKSLDEAGVKFILNPYDEFAVEEALRRKEKAGPGEVVVIALGPAAAQETIRTALAMGADRGILLQADRIPTDGLEVAKRWPPSSTAPASISSCSARWRSTTTTIRSAPWWPSCSTCRASPPWPTSRSRA